MDLIYYLGETPAASRRSGRSRRSRGSRWRCPVLVAGDPRQAMRMPDPARLMERRARRRARQPWLLGGDASVSGEVEAGGGEHGRSRSQTEEEGWGWRAWVRGAEGVREMDP